MAINKVFINTRFLNYLISSGMLFANTINVHGISAAAQENIDIPKVVSYRSISCGCCKKWINHLRDNGLEVVDNILEDKEIIVIDTRNIYEIAIGTFKGAINPNTHFFREFPDYVRNYLNPNKHKKVAMFCTGGIRCEKASSYLLKKGFKEVFHLKGGVLNYLKNISKSQSLWQGECFVFDERVAVKHKLEKGNYKMCKGCGYPLLNKSDLFDCSEKNNSCPHCDSSLNIKERL